MEELRFRLFPEVYDPFASDVLSKCLKRDTRLHLGHGIGLADYRDIQSALIHEFEDPEALPINPQDEAADLQQGHGSTIAKDYYGLRPDKPRGISKGTIKAFRRSSRWWQHITGKQD